MPKQRANADEWRKWWSWTRWATRKQRTTTCSGSSEFHKSDGQSCIGNNFSPKDLRNLSSESSCNNKLPHQTKSKIKQRIQLIKAQIQEIPLTKRIPETSINQEIRLRFIKAKLKINKQAFGDKKIQWIQGFDTTAPPLYTTHYRDSGRHKVKRRANNHAITRTQKPQDSIRTYLCLNANPPDWNSRLLNVEKTHWKSDRPGWNRRKLKEDHKL